MKAATTSSTTMAWLAVGYLLVFPITLRFLADYQVSAAVPNHISLDSYMDNFLMMIFKKNCDASFILTIVTEKSPAPSSP